MPGVNEQIKNLGEISKKTGVNLLGLGQNVERTAKGLSQLAYSAGRAASGVAKLMQSPMVAGQKFQKLFDDATSSVANFENAVYLGGQRLATFSNEFKSVSQATDVYKKAIDKAKEGTRLTTLESEKLFKTLSEGFRGIQTQRVVNDFASIQKQAALMGGTVEEIQRIINQIGPASAKYSQLREALAGGDFKRAGRIADLLQQSGGINYGEYSTIMQMANRGVTGEPSGLRANARNRFESERAIRQAGFDTAQAIGISGLPQGTLRGAAASAAAQSGMAGRAGYGEMAAYLGLAGEFGNTIAGAGALGSASGASGTGGQGVGLVGGGKGMSPANPVYVLDVGGGIFGGGGGAAGAVGAAGAAGGSKLLRGLSSLKGLGALALAGSSVYGIGEMVGDLAGGGTGENMFSRSSVGQATEGAMSGVFNWWYGTNDPVEKSDRFKKKQEEIAKAIKTDGVGAIESVTTKLEDWKQANLFVLESTQGLVSAYEKIESVAGTRVGYAQAAAVASKERAKNLREEYRIEMGQLDILEKQYQNEMRTGDADTQLAAAERLTQQREKMFRLSVAANDAELKSKTSIIDAANELQKQEISLSKVIRDRNIEARLGIGVSYEDQLNIIQDVAAQIPILEQRLQEQLRLAAAARERGEMGAAIDFQRMAKDTQIEIEQAKLEFFRESKAIREGYLDAFKENIFGAGGFAKIMPKVGQGNQFFADIAPLGGVGKSSVTTPGKYTTSGLQVSGGYSETVNYLNRGVTAQLYGALKGAESQGGLDPLAEQMLGGGGSMVSVANSTEKLNQRTDDLSKLIGGVINGGAMNVNITGGSVVPSYSMASANGVGVSFNPSAGSGVNSNAGFVSPFYNPKNSLLTQVVSSMGSKILSDYESENSNVKFGEQWKRTFGYAAGFLPRMFGKVVSANRNYLSKINEQENIRQLMSRFSEDFNVYKGGLMSGDVGRAVNCSLGIVELIVKLSGELDSEKVLSMQAGETSRTAMNSSYQSNGG